VGDAWRPAVAVGGQELCWVPQFKYLGSQFHEGGGLNAELRHRLALGAAAFARLGRPFFRPRRIRLRTRMQVYNCMVMSVLLYGAEAWAYNEEQLQPLEVFHHRCLRQMLGVRRSLRMAIPELLRRCGSRSISTMLAGRQLRWLGHLGRMGDERIAKRALYSTLAAPGTRCRGRQPPRLGDMYMQLVQRHLPSRALARAGLPRAQRNWHAACQDRTVWHRICADVLS
jgi:hypothetical protein